MEYLLTSCYILKANQVDYFELEIQNFHICSQKKIKGR